MTEVINHKKRVIVLHGVNLQRLISLTEYQPVRIPADLIREQRREWVKTQKGITDGKKAEKEDCQNHNDLGNGNC